MKKDIKTLTIIGLFSLLMLFGVFRLDIVSNFTENDFNMSNIEVVGNNIQLIEQNKIISSPRYGDIYPNDLNHLNYYIQKNSGLYFCQELGLDFVSESSYYVSTEYDNALWYSDHWTFNDNQKYIHIDSAIICLGGAGYFTSGNIEQINPITTTEKYNYFELNISFNGTIKPYLIIGLDKIYFENNVIHQEVMSDTQIKLGFDFESDGSSTPQLLNNIQLFGTFKDNSNNDMEDNNDKTLTLLGIYDVPQKNNYISNLDFNLKIILTSPIFWILIILTLIYLKKNGLLKI